MHTYMKVDGGSIALRGASPHRGGSGWFELRSFSEQIPNGGSSGTRRGGRISLLVLGKPGELALFHLAQMGDRLTRVSLETVMPGRVPLWIVLRDVLIDGVQVVMNDQDGDDMVQLTCNYETRQTGHGPLPAWSPSRRGS